MEVKICNLSLLVVVFSRWVRVWQELESSQDIGMALARCIPSTFLGVVCYCSSLPLYVTIFTAKCLQFPNNVRAPSSESGTVGENGIR
jgi:hypothetical protein